jgi:hypothetical protein
VILPSFDEAAWQDKIIAEVTVEALDPYPIAGYKLRLDDGVWLSRVAWPQHAVGTNDTLS